MLSKGGRCEEQSSRMESGILIAYQVSDRRETAVVLLHDIRSMSD